MLRQGFKHTEDKDGGEGMVLSKVLGVRVEGQGKGGRGKKRHSDKGS